MKQELYQQDKIMIISTRSKGSSDGFQDLDLKLVTQWAKKELASKKVQPKKHLRNKSSHQAIQRVPNVYVSHI